MSKKATFTVAVAIASTLMLSACGGDRGTAPGTGSSGPLTTSTSPSGGDVATATFNDTDVTFGTDMISHHRQAVDMAALADTRAESAEVKALAAQIRGAQDPEIQTMSGWLAAWGKSVPEDMSGMDMSGSMPGMMSTADMGKLESSSGSQFDRMFLTMMVAHHQGAIEMARTEMANGSNADAIALARQIKQAQTAEIATMRGLLEQ